MQKLWLKKLKLSYSKDVFDIVQFGSSVEENKIPNDIDIAVIFNKIPIKEQLIQAQEIKRQLENKSELPIHITSFDLYSFFESSNFAKDSILFLGKSLIYNGNFSKRFGLSPKIQIYYSLNKLAKKDKIRFNYMLNGKNGMYGLLRRYDGRLLKPGLIEINPEYEGIFIDSIKDFDILYKVRKVLE
jgi:predicted nucleotidyltransferase